MPASGERDDRALVAAARAGDSAAFSALINKHKGPLYRLVRRYVGDADEALDLVQESFVACWSHLDAFDLSRPFPVWLRRIALNKCRDWSRRRKVRQFFFTAKPIEADVLALSTADLDDARLAALDRAIAALPQTLKEPFLLTVIDELSHQQAAALLAITPKAVETRVYRAKRQLRATLDDKPR